MSVAARTFLAAAALLAAIGADASRIVHRPLASVVADAALVVVARIVGVHEPAPTEFERSLQVEATPLRVLRGSPSSTKLACTYVEGRPHQRGGATVSPLVSGSGRESELKAGATVLLLIGATDRADAGCRLLRAEPLAREEEVRALLKGR